MIEPLGIISQEVLSFLSKISYYIYVNKSATDITAMIKKRCAELAEEAAEAEREWVAKNGPRPEEPVDVRSMSSEEFNKNITKIFNGKAPTAEEMEEGLKYARR